MFSIIIPFKGRIAYLLEAVASLQAQILPEEEGVLINEDKYLLCSTCN
jgi:glycosyltransferase involved in cell wall biosynthesis